MAVYPESLLAALTLGAFLMARRGRWVWASLLAGLGSATHPLAALLAVPLGLLYLREHKWRLRWDVLWIALVPAGYGAFMAYLALKGLEPLSVLSAHEKWLRFFHGPIGGTWMAIRAAVAGAHQLLSGQSTHVYWSPAISYGLSPMNAARADVTLFAFLMLAVWGMIGAFRWLGLAYGAYVLAALVSVVPTPLKRNRWRGSVSTSSP